MKFDAFGTSKHGEGKSLLKKKMLYLSVHWGDLIEQIKKICHIHFNRCSTVSQLMPNNPRDNPIAHGVSHGTETNYKEMVLSLPASLSKHFVTHESQA